ncbi:MAG: DUF1573 domain-containing protein [Phycisphaerales bacterium]|nr:DUF1573 domain-containing protein [Phycisphaerales bacterium]
MRTTTIFKTRILALAGLSVASVIALAGCIEKSDPAGSAVPAKNEQPSTTATNTNSTAGTSWVDGTPILTFSRPVYAFGDMLETETRQAEIGFTNTGDGTLKITEVKTTCGCTAASLPKYIYQPGESGMMSVSFEPTGPNEPNQPQRKYVNVFSNAMPAGESTKLMITANVMPFIELEPRMVTPGELPLGEEHRSVLKISSIDPDFKLVDVKAESPLIGIVRMPAEFDDFTKKRYERVQVVVPANAPWGGLYSAIDITVRGKTSPDAEPIEHTSKIRFGAQLYGKLRASPRDRFGFGIKPNESFDRELILSREDGEPFNVLNHHLEAGSLPNASVEVKKISPNSWSFTLTGTGGPIPMNYNGRVVVRTDVPGEEQIELPIFGVVRE